MLHFSPVISLAIRLLMLHINYAMFSSMSISIFIHSFPIQAPTINLNEHGFPRFVAKSFSPIIHASLWWRMRNFFSRLSCHPLLCTEINTQNGLRGKMSKKTFRRELQCDMNKSRIATKYRSSWIYRAADLIFLLAFSCLTRLDL